MTFIEMAAAGRPAPAARERKKLGDGMLTPVQLVEFRNPWNGGRVEQLRPGRDHVSYDWWGYKQNPELFRVCNRGDTRTAARHRENLDRTRRHIERQLERTGTTRASTSSRQGGFRLATSRPRKWRLP